MSDMGTQIRDYLDGTTAPIGAREIIMGSTFTEESETAPPKPNPPWRWAVVAVAVAAVIVIGLLLLPGGDDGVAPIDQPDGEGAPADVNPSTSVAVVEAAIAAFNAGDAASIQAMAASDDDAILGWLLGPEAMVEAKAEANARFVLDEPCREGDGDFVICEGVETNDYWAAAGLERRGQLIVEVVDGLMTNEVDFISDVDGTLVTFGNSFLSWFSRTYPNVYDSLPSYEGEGAGSRRVSVSTSGVPVAGAMSTVLDYVDEFVAQSDQYPIAP